jgi:hypothetical protein
MEVGYQLHSITVFIHKGKVLDICWIGGSGTTVILDVMMRKILPLP